jgi:hypothetical protein
MSASVTTAMFGIEMWHHRHSSVYDACSALSGGTVPVACREASSAAASVACAAAMLRPMRTQNGNTIRNQASANNNNITGDLLVAWAITIDR